MKKISRKKLEEFGVKSFTPKKGFGKHALHEENDMALGLYYKYNAIAKAVSIIAFVPILFVYGFANISEATRDIRDVWTKKWIRSDVIWKTSKRYEDMKKWYCEGKEK